MDELSVSVELPEPPELSAMLEGFRDAVRLPEDDVAVSVTVPLNPPRLVRLMVELPLEPRIMLTVVGLALIVKSGTLTVRVMLWEREPVVAVIVTVYVPGRMPLVEEKIRVEAPEDPLDNAIVVGLRVTVGPEGETVAVSDTLPDSPLTLDSVMVEFADVPGGAESEFGLATIVKSTTCTMICTEWRSEPLVPVIVTV